MSEDFIEVKEQLIDMYNFNKHIKIELKPLGAKAILDYIDSKDKEIERLNNILNRLEKAILTTYPCMDTYDRDFKSELLNILKDLKEEN